MTTIGLRAMDAELDIPTQKLRSVSVVFAGKVVPGPLEVQVAVLRRGRSASQLTATVRNEGSEAGHTSIAVFGGERPGFEFTDIAMPDVPPPEQCRSFWDEAPDGFARRFNPTFWRRAEGRAALGHAPWGDWEPTSSERALWYRFVETPWGHDGTVDPYALVTFCDTMPGAVGERMGPGAPLWLAPSADLTVHILGEARSDWILAHNRARHAGEGYASVEMVLWDQGGRLVAYGTQMCIFSFPDGPPLADRRRAP